MSDVDKKWSKSDFSVRSGALPLPVRRAEVPIKTNSHEYNGENGYLPPRLIQKMYE